MLPEYVLVGVDKETCRSACRVAYPVPDIGVHKLHNHTDYMSWRPELTVLACYLKLAEEVLVDVPLRIPVLRCYIQVIENGVNLKRFKPLASAAEKCELRGKLGLKEDGEIVVFVGPIAYRKGIDILLRAWIKIAAERPTASLVLVGPRFSDLRGAEDARLPADFFNIIEQPGMKDRIIFTGMVNNVEQYFQAADLFVFPSRREGMPNVVPEAFASGVPTILTPFVGLPEEFGHPNEEYALVERTPEALESAIVDLLDHPEKRAQLSENALKWVRAEMDVEHSLDQYVALYQKYLRS